MLCVWVLCALLGLASPARAGLEDLVLEEVADLEDPAFVTHAGDERLFVARLFGQIMIVKDGELLPEPFLDISDRGGRVFSIAFHPDYAENGYFYVHRVDPEAPAGLITRFRVSARNPDRADPDSEVELVRIPKAISMHFGGQLAFGSDGYLYASTGDTNDVDEQGQLLVDPECGPQSLDRLDGKILRLDVDRNLDREPYYAIPPDNPLIGVGRREIWAAGLRNPWRFSFDRETGDLWIADVGQDELEEVNFQAASSPGGENYGWKVMEGTACHGDTTGCRAAVPLCSDPSLTSPVLEYTHDEGRCAVVGGLVYRGCLVPALYGRYVYGDHCTGTLWAARRQDDTFSTRKLRLSMPGLVSFGEDVHGALYLLQEGGVFRLVDSSIPDAGVVDLVETELEVTEGSAELRLGLRRSGAVVGPATVEVRRRGGTASIEDSPFSSETVSWTDGEAGDVFLSVPISNDTLVEPEETLILELASPTGGAVLGARTVALVRVLDDDDPPCVADRQHLCLNRGRFRVSMSWRTAQGATGLGNAEVLGADSGSFWFFSANNPEVFVKVLDACFKPVPALLGLCGRPDYGGDDARGRRHGVREGAHLCTAAGDAVRSDSGHVGVRYLSVGGRDRLPRATSIGSYGACIR